MSSNNNTVITNEEKITDGKKKEKINKKMQNANASDAKSWRQNGPSCQNFITQQQRNLTQFESNNQGRTATNRVCCNFY